MDVVRRGMEWLVRITFERAEHEGVLGGGDIIELADPLQPIVRLRDAVADKTFRIGKRRQRQELDRRRREAVCRDHVVGKQHTICERVVQLDGIGGEISAPFGCRKRQISQIAGRLADRELLVTGKAEELVLDKWTAYGEAELIP